MTPADRAGGVRTPRVDPPLAAMWVAAVLYAAATSAGFVVLVEWGHYSSRFQWWRLSPRDELLLFWVLFAKSLWILTPPMVLAGVLLWYRRLHAAWTLVTTALIGVFAWLSLDLYVNEDIGTHVTDYVAFVVARSAWDPGMDQAWAVWPIVHTLVRTALLLLLGSGLFWRFGQLQSTSARSLGARRRVLAVSAAYLAAALSVTPAIWVIGEPIVWQDLAATLPIALPLPSDRRALVSDDEDEFLARFNREAAGVALRVADRLTVAGPPDATARVPEGPHPNVVLIVPEDTRHESLDPRWMPRLDAWAKGGLRFTRHYAGTNASQLGFFALLYGRHPLVYDVTLDAAVPPPFPEILHHSGYHTAYFASGPLNPNRVREYINAQSFDRMVLDTDGNEWWQRDLRTLGRVADLLAERPDQRWFVVVSLMATHAMYRYPPQYAHFTPVLDLATMPPFWAQGAPTPELRTAIMNRYLNAVAFTDDAVADLLERLDPRRNLVILTSDHGNSFFDDGSWMHLGPLSDVQTRVPLVMRGPGIPVGLVTRATIHTDVLPTVLHALAGQAVSVQHLAGRDQLTTGWPDQVLLSKTLAQREMILVRGASHLHLRFGLDPFALYSPGFGDSNARLDGTIHKRPEEADRWAAALAWDLERVVR